MDQSDNHSQLIQPRNTYKRFKEPVTRFLQRLGYHNAVPPTTTQYQGAHGFNITGNPTSINTGMNNGEISVTNVNNYGGIHGLEKMEKLVSFNAQFDSRVQDPEHQCHPGTRETVLAQMRNWIDDLDTTEPIFWLCGPAGAGKSAIARTLALSYGRPKIAATFFFYRSDGSRNDGNLLFTTLAYQLSISIPAIKDLVAKSLNERPDLSMTAIETQFEELLVRPLQALNASAFPAPAIIIIDGVDECTDEKLQRRFLLLICTAVRDNRIPLRFIISSRREAHIENIINKTRCPNIRLDLSELDADSNIKTYLTDKFSDIASSQELDPKVWPGSHKIEKLVSRASGQFAYASLVIRDVGNEDCSAETQLDIILGLRPPTTTSPFQHLNELYLNILERHPDQDFLTTFLTLFIAVRQFRSFDLHKDYSLLMNITEKEFHIKLRRLCSVFKFEPNIDIYHRSFLEFLECPSRSGQYHIKEEVAARRYLELITESLVRYGSRVIEDPHTHDEIYHFRPKFGLIVHAVPLKVLLAVERWQQVLHPLLVVWNKLLDFPNFSPNSNFLSCSECTGFRIIRHLLFNLMFSEDTLDQVAPSSMSNTQKTSRPIALYPPFVPEVGKNTLEKSLSDCLTSLLAHRRKAKSELSTVVYLLLLLLRFNPSEIAKNIRSVPDALAVVNLVDTLTTENYLISQCGPDAILRAFQLALEIYARVPILPLSLLCSIFPKPGGPGVANFKVYSDHCSHWKCHSFSNIAIWQTPFTETSRILGRNCIIPVLWIYDDIFAGQLNFGHICIGSPLKVYTPPISSWRERLVYILELAKFFQDFHSGDIVLHHEIDPVSEFQHLEFPAKIRFWGVSTSYVKETPHLDVDEKARLTFEANILIFGRLFYCLYFGAFKPFDDYVLYDGDMVLNHPLETELHEDAWQIIQRCCAEDPKNRPTIDEVIQEINVVIGHESTLAPPLHSVQVTKKRNFDDVVAFATLTVL